MALGGTNRSGGNQKTSSPKTTNGVTKNGSVGIGAKSAKVQSIQKQLTAAGFTVKADGKFGAKTKAAVEAFQAKAKLKADGFVGATTLGALGKAKPASGKPAATAAVDAPKGPAGMNKTATLGKLGPNHSYTGGKITVNGRTYTFNSGGSPNAQKGWAHSPSLPPGSYKITGKMEMTKKQRTGSMQVRGVAYKYGVSNKKDPRVGGIVRDGLRIHPDGMSPGTQGCIGIVGGPSVQQQFQKDMQAELNRGGGNFTLNVGN
jgi:peptidoglycan hydrolase-like protein with peptidoglycan-binding domain